MTSFGICMFTVVIASRQAEPDGFKPDELATSVKCATKHAQRELCNDFNPLKLVEIEHSRCSNELSRQLLFTSDKK